MGLKNNLFVSLSTLLFISMVLTSCSKPNRMNALDYKQWIENSDNGISNIKSIDDFEFSVLYKPVDYIIAMENRGKNISTEAYNKRKKELSGYQYYTFRIRSDKDNEFFRTGISSENEYYERLEYYVSNAQNDILLVEGNDTIQCAVYHFERNYGVSPYGNIVLSFEEKKENNNCDKLFIYDDKALGVGKVAFKIKANEINNLPKLNI